jgi:hypothetical protein
MAVFLLGIVTGLLGLGVGLLTIYYGPRFRP